MLVDSHCHLDLLDLHSFSGGLEGVIDAAREQGVTHLLCVSINLENYPRMLSLVERLAEVSVSVGVHPNERGGHEPLAGELVELAAHPRVVAIGETGLDYFRSEGELEWQRERFRNHIRAAKQAGKPLIVHSRDAKEDTLAILREEDAGEAGGVMHCFTGDWEMAKRAMDLNFYISFSGIVTFNSARELMDVARRMPAGAHAGGNGLPLPGAGAPPRQAQPAGLRASCRGAYCEPARRIFRAASPRQRRVIS